MDLGPHAGTILACYGVVFGVIAGLVVWLVLDGRRQAQALADIESRGIRRRSAAGPSAAEAAPSSPEPNSRT